MPTPKVLFVSAIVVMLPATGLLTAQAGRAETAADECRTKPGSSGPPGTHWYYRLDRSDNRRCWYLGPAKGGNASADTRSNAGVAPPVPKPRHENAAGKSSAAVRPVVAETASSRTAVAQTTPAQTAPAPTAPAAAIPKQTTSAQPTTAQTASSQTILSLPMAAQTAAAKSVPAHIAPTPGAPIDAAEPSVGEQPATLDFAARWPNLRTSRDLDAPAPAAMSNDHGKQLAAQHRQQPPHVAETNRYGTPQSTAKAALEPAFLASALTMALLLLIGMVWACRSCFRDPCRKAATDRPHDIKADLRELMHDLRRAGSPRPYQDGRDFAPAL